MMQMHLIDHLCILECMYQIPEDDFDGALTINIGEDPWENEYAAPFDDTIEYIRLMVKDDLDSIESRNQLIHYLAELNVS